MDWPTSVVLETITGIHIALWLLAYAAWRYLTGPHWARRARVAHMTRTVSASDAVCRTPALPAARWARRAAMVNRLHDERARVQLTRRRLQRAA